MKKKVLIAAFWLAVWEILALLVNNPILIAGPVDTIRALSALAITGDFWRSLGSSLLRIVCGFAAGSLLGIALAFIAFRFKTVSEILSPFVSAMRSVPVASFVILFLIWFGNRNLSFYICITVVFPILYLNTMEGLGSLDGQILEMASVFEVPASKRFFYIDIPGLYPFWYSAFELSIGMAWKSGVAAEVIGQPLLSVGNGLYRSKIYLDTAQLLAWTLTVLLVSMALEKVFLVLLSRLPGGGNKK